MKLVWDKPPTSENSRNSEGSFLRLSNGSILFAYSRYNSADSEDAAGCDVAAIYSYDEGESWSDPVILVRAGEFGVKNIMSVSCIEQRDGRVGVYFIIKENDGSSSIGRLLSDDGIHFEASRCRLDYQKSYYVFNNDRLVRLSDGRLCLPVAMHGLPSPMEAFAVSLVLFSEDDGASFAPTSVRLALSALREREAGMQEPGLIEHLDGTLRLWARTTRGSQYESYSRDGFRTATDPSPSLFTSPASPMEIARDPHNTENLYAVYNPIPGYQRRSRDYEGVSMGRTPLVIRRSTDDGRTWGNLYVIESEPDRGYCYPALFFTKDRSLLCAYCRGNKEDGICLSRLGIMKISLDEVARHA